MVFPAVARLIYRVCAEYSLALSRNVELHENYGHLYVIASNTLSFIYYYVYYDHLIIFIRHV